jgi:guanylate kinase
MNDMTTARLFIVDGMSGVWKHDLVYYVDHVLVDATVVRKITSRGPRDGEDLSLIDLEHVDRATFERVMPDFVYEYGGELYGVQSSAIEQALNRYQSVFVIIRNRDIILHLKAKFRRYCPTSVFVYTDSELINPGLPVSRSRKLRDSIRDSLSDYLHHPETYDEVIINASSARDFYSLLDLVISRGATRPSYWYKGMDRTRMVIVTTKATRTVLQGTLAAIAAVGIGFSVNIITGAQFDYGRIVALILTAVLLCLVATAELALAVSWRELE